MKLHAQNQLYTSIIFWEITVLKASLGMPDHTHLNLYNQFITLTDMKLHAQNQVYTSFSFWDFFFYNKHVHNKGTKEKVTITKH